MCEPPNVPRLKAHTAAEFRQARAGAYSWRLRSDIRGNPVWLRSPEKLAGDDSLLIKTPAAGAGARVIRFQHDGQNLVLKEYRPTRAATKLKGLFRTPPALRALRTCVLLENLGFPVVEALGAGYRVGSAGHSFLVTRELASVVPLKNYARRSPKMRSQVIRLLAELLGKLHAANFMHRDAHLANFVVQTDGEPLAMMIDVDAVKPCRGVTLPLAARDLARLLDYSEPAHPEMVRFAAIYSRARNGAISARALLRKMREPYENRARLPGKKP